ncbi:hypothetical protein Lepto7375DRAFT_4726 [Leptolyngbya sp. PCC 7375]|nr:hypothetical protein Lepto7375DRAFT_4726 [Leptolyngbya sp. PCC 7375]
MGLIVAYPFNFNASKYKTYRQPLGGSPCFLKSNFMIHTQTSKPTLMSQFILFNKLGSASVGTRVPLHPKIINSFR